MWIRDVQSLGLRQESLDDDERSGDLRREVESDACRTKKDQ